MREMNASRASLSFLDTSRDDRVNSETSSNSGLGFGNKLQMYKSYDSLDVRALKMSVCSAYKLHGCNYTECYLSKSSLNFQNDPVIFVLSCFLLVQTSRAQPDFFYLKLVSHLFSFFGIFVTVDTVLLSGANTSVYCVKLTANCCTLFLKWTIVNITQKYWPTLLFTEDLISLYLNYLAPKITLKIIE